MLSNNFWKKIRYTSSCWIWEGTVDRDGYGRYKHEGKNCGAHRLTYESLEDIIPIGLELDHLCKNPPCVNPAHLDPVTHRENILRGESFSAIEARRTVCPKGHEYTQEKKGRRCLICQSESKKQYYQLNQDKIKKKVMERYYAEKLEEVIIEH